MRINVHLSLHLAWGIASVEAMRSGSTLIEPEHFLLSVLSIVDGVYPDDLFELTPESRVEIKSAAAQCREVMQMSADEVTRARRELRKALHIRGADASTLRMLHRSPASHTLFEKAMRRAVDERAVELTIVHLLKELMANPPKDASLFSQYSQAAGHEGAASTSYINDHTEQSEHDKPATPVIDEMGLDLTALARAGRLAPVVGRKQEMTAVARFLQRTTKRNVILTGEAGVGKTAIVEGLAQRLVAENAPEFLRALRIVQINVADLVAGTKYRGEMEGRVRRLMDEAVSDPHLVLFFDEIHLMMNAGAGGDSPLDIANILKSALARDDFRCLGATTTEEFERYVKPDAAFMRRFQVLQVPEPDEEAALEICRQWAQRITSLQKVKVDDEAVEAAVRLSALHIRGRALPDKAIDLLENAAAYTKITSITFSSALPPGIAPRIGRQEIIDVLEEQYGVSVSAARALDVAQLAAVLQNELIGQDAAVAEITDALRARTANTSNAPRPLGVFLFTGATGVGKTFTAELMARAFFGREAGAFFRINMNEYKERHELSRLTGAAPGFIGHERRGALFSFAADHPQGLILLDEMEKAHPEIQDYFLQIFDKGEAMDSRGRKGDFRHHIFVMTCNVVAEASKRRIGLINNDPEAPSPNALTEQLAKTFRREFLARIDRIVSFRSLDADDFCELCDRNLASLRERVEREHGIRLEVEEDARRHLCTKGAAQDEGVRGFNRLYERTLEAPLLDFISTATPQKAVTVGLADDQLVFTQNNNPTDS
ncbi:MAG TPA: ATP-dependent Clp protease ATP-binding subunit [Pyrinomonadaceae bacterium]|jgi:ATP-dependent Clp protease ATP-binding subunit ClpC